MRRPLVAQAFRPASGAAQKGIPTMTSRKSAIGAAVLLVMAAGSRGSADSAKLVDAAKARDRAAVQTLIKQHADINAPAADGSTALYYAAENNDLEMVKALIAAG